MDRVDQKKMGIADYCVSKKHNRMTRLDEIDRIIDWKPLERLLLKHLPRKANAVGNPAYPAIIMFKCLILQRLYNLSDVQLEEALVDRISFLRFAGLGMEDDIPDSSTICRFRNSLLHKNLSKKLFDAFIAQLQDKGLTLSQGVAVDASVIRSARHPRKVIESMPSDRNEPDLHEDDSTDTDSGVAYSDDSEAAWVIKAGKPNYGYKLHLISDVQSGIILAGHATPANRSDMNELPRLVSSLSNIRGKRCYADKGYASKSNRKTLRELGLKDGIMSKASRGHSLTQREQRRNRIISTFRSGIERIFGNLKRNLGFSRSRYVGRDKVEQEFFLVAFAANLIRTVKLACV